MKIFSILLILTCFTGFSKLNAIEKSVPKKFSLLATTTHLGDLALQIAGDQINVNTLMGPGIDPHSYRATAQDIVRLQAADFVLFHGLSLEGKIARVLQGTKRKGKTHYSPCEELPKKTLIFSNDKNKAVDPHVWFSPELWLRCANSFTKKLSQVLPEHRNEFEENLSKFKSSITEIDRWGKSLIQTLPQTNRILITSHDAFQYFGHHFEIRVIGLQGINTMVEAGLADRTNLSDFIEKHQSPALFVESSVNPKALEEIAKETGASIGGTLFSDALGTGNEFVKGPTGEKFSTATWQGMMIHNLIVIEHALKKRL